MYDIMYDEHAINNVTLAGSNLYIFSLAIGPSVITNLTYINDFPNVMTGCSDKPMNEHYDIYRHLLRI